MTKKKQTITKLTSEMEALIPIVRDRCIEIGLSTDPCDRPFCEETADLCYKIAGYAPPLYKVWFGSALAGSFAATLANNQLFQKYMDIRYAKAFQRQAAGKVLAPQQGDDNPLSLESIWAQLENQLLAQMLEKGEVPKFSRPERAAEELRTQIEDEFENGISSFPQGAYGSHNTFLAFTDFFEHFMDIPDIQGLSRMRQCGWWWPFDDLVILTERPSLIKFDQNNVAHSAVGPAIAYPDGFSVYCWRGTRIPGEWIEDTENVDPSLALTWPNIEQRRCLAEIIGWEKVLDPLDAEIIDKDPNPRVGTLLRADIPESPGQHFLRVECPTGRTFVLPVPEGFETAKAANAGTFRFAADDWHPEVET